MRSVLGLLYTINPFLYCNNNLEVSDEYFPLNKIQDMQPTYTKNEQKPR